MGKERVIDLVSEQLRHHHPGGVTIVVEPDAVLQRNDYWYVPVRPSSQPPKMFEYYEALAEVEATLQEDEGLEVFLVPSIPDEQEAAPPVPAAIPSAEA